MKKKSAAVLGIALSACMAVVLTACGIFDLGKGDNNYPYDIAVSEGYTESEGSWLAETTPTSTLYRRLWEEAVADGSFSGTYFEFLKELDLGDGGAYLQNSLLSAVSVVAYMNSSSASAGAGVILSVDAASGDMDVMTNYHVVYSAASQRIYNHIELYLYGSETSAQKLTATYTGGSASEDIALLHVEGSDKVIATGSGAKTYTNREIVQDSAAKAVTIGDSDALLAGDKVYAIGNPEAWGISVTEGVVSVDAEYVTMESIDGSGEVSMLEIRTDATVNHGNSGGGLFNAAGELIGIVNARSEANGVEGVGYAIPVDHAMAVAENIRANGGSLSYARLGITIETAESRSVFDPVSGRTFRSEKLVVRSVTEGAAKKSGMDVGDTIVSLTLGGKTVEATRRYKVTNLLLEVRKGDSLTVVVSRDGQPKTLQVTFDADGYFETGI